MSIVKHDGRFPEFWDCFKKFEKAGLVTMGNKKKAFEAYKALKLSDSQHDQMIEAALAMGREKFVARKRGEFRENFQQPERYLRHQRFEDEIPEELTAAESAELNQLANESIQKRIFDRTWAAGIIDPETKKPYSNCGV